MTRACVMATLLAATPLGGVAAQESPAVKIGVFDANRISEETDEGKRIAARLTAFGEKKKAELGAKEKEIADIRQQIETQSLSLSTEKTAQLQRELQRKGLELQQGQEAARNEFQIEVGEAQTKFQDQLFRVLNQFGRDEGFTLILERNSAGVAFASEAVDVTTAVVDRFNVVIRSAVDEKPAEKSPAAKLPPPAPAKQP